MEIHGPCGFCMAARNSPLSNVRKLQVHEALKTNVYWSANLFTNAMHQLSLCAWKPPCLLGAQPFCLTANQPLACFEELWHKACHFQLVGCDSVRSHAKFLRITSEDQNTSYAILAWTDGKICFRTLWIQLGSGSQDAKWTWMCASKNTNCWPQLSRVSFCGADSALQKLIRPAGRPGGAKIVSRIEKIDAKMPKGLPERARKIQRVPSRLLAAPSRLLPAC